MIYKIYRIFRNKVQDRPQGGPRPQVYSATAPVATPAARSTSPSNIDAPSRGCSAFRFQLSQNASSLPPSAFSLHPFKRASSLITTLLVLVVLSTIVVAFMQSMSVERNVAKSAKNIMQAEYSTQAGLSAAISQILFVMNTNQAFVTGQTNYATGFGPLTVIGRDNLTNTTQIMPLASGPLIFSAFGSSAWSNQLASFYSALTNTSSVDANTKANLIQATTNTNVYRSAWVYLTNTLGETNGRFAYVVLDDCARLNPQLHNGATSQTNSTNWYSGASDISLTNSNASILTAAQFNTLSTAVTYLLSDATAAQGFAARTNFDTVKHLLTTSTNPTFDVIPSGLINAALPKYNINRLATNSTSYSNTWTNAAEAIADLITTNLPSFGSRDPSLRGTASSELRYVRRLAANIVDYIDSDSSPTYVNGGEPAGRDQFPLVTTIASQYTRTAYDGNSNPSSATIESRVFVQVWNPYTTPIQLTNAVIGFKLKNRLRVTFGTGIVEPFDDYDKTTNATLTIRPNEFVVFEFPKDTKTWTSPGPTTTNTPYWGTPPSTVNSSMTADQTTWMPFELSINGQVVDMNRRAPVGVGVPGNTAHSGLTHNFKNFSTSGVHYQVNFIPIQSSAPTWRFVGDPRATFLSNYDWGTPISSDASYASSTRWKGRQDNTGSRSQDFVSNWVNRDFVRANPSLGGTPGSINTTPANVSSSYNLSSDAPSAIAVIRNGAMVSIGELGHVFDPVQAADDLTAPSGGTPGSPYVSAGGRTLRIGQSDFAASATNSWNTNGRSATQLLDLFTVNSTNPTSGGYPTAVGRLNINTAPTEVIAAILSGIKLTSDSGIPARALANLSNISSLIISNRPYNQQSDYSRFLSAFAAATNYQPAFNSSTGGGTTNIDAVDRVREEAFGKIVQHFTTQSRTYRVVVLGEAFEKGKVRASTAAEALVYFQTNSLGSFQPIIQWNRYIK